MGTATDMTAATPGTIATMTLSATPGNCHRLELPVSPTFDVEVSCFPRTTDAKLLTVGATQAEDAAISTTAYATLPAGQWTTFRVPHDVVTTRRIFASATASQVIEIEINRAARA